ncbi:MAG: DUF2817 domain-containing protein [Oligoflexia bacterium]|nr:DUF2817 domain-containing protein [Oligoflexia bacterium]
MFPEWVQFEKIVKELSRFGQIHELGTVKTKDNEFPLIALSFGSKDPKAPVLGLFGGVHGLERIGAQVVLSMLQSFSELLLWDQMIRHALEHIRIMFMPIVNPTGMFLNTRSNANGIDLMRNAPIEALEKVTPLVGGHRISPKIPWYRGPQNQPMEPEAQAVFDLSKKLFFESKSVITVDFHSGFGVVDRLWFPYAKTKDPFPHMAEMYVLKENFDRTYPNHVYKIEPQSKNYTTHGDLWDYVYDEYQKVNSGAYLALCLEMGSWNWVKKKPSQIFSLLGPFNPIEPHRVKRTLRRHNTLFEFLIRSLVSYQSWSTMSDEQRMKNMIRAKEHWYE